MPDIEAGPTIKLVADTTLEGLQTRLQKIVFSPSQVQFEQDTYLKVTAKTLLDLYDLLGCCLKAGYPVDAPLLEEVTLYVQHHLEGRLE